MSGICDDGFGLRHGQAYLSVTSATSKCQYRSNRITYMGAGNEYWYMSSCIEVSNEATIQSDLLRGFPGLCVQPRTRRCGGTVVVNYGYELYENPPPNRFRFYRHTYCPQGLTIPSNLPMPKGLQPTSSDFNKQFRV